jgi:hypothetical protein
MSEKVRENRLRRMAERQGLRLEKSRRRDRRALDYGRYQLVDAGMTRRSHHIVHQDWAVGQGFGLTLDEVEAYLTREGDGG